MQTDYEKYRGKCKEFVDALCLSNSNFTPVRGWYICPIWGEQHHWWAIDKEGNINDPTKNQFPSKGFGEYIPFDGTIECEYCGNKVLEKDAYFVGHHAYCSYTCYGKDVM